jgi:hypothetical protein
MEPLHLNVSSVAVSSHDMNRLVKYEHKITTAHVLLLGIYTSANRVLILVPSR